jgi:hypothetical protein
MRVSKRFIGAESIGKHFFSKQSNINAHQDIAALKDAKQERDILHHEFLMSLQGTANTHASDQRKKRSTTPPLQRKNILTRDICFTEVSITPKSQQTKHAATPPRSSLDHASTLILSRNNCAPATCFTFEDENLDPIFVEDDEEADFDFVENGDSPAWESNYLEV